LHLIFTRRLSDSPVRDQQGKPGALLAVHYSNQTSMWMPMLRGFLVDLLMAWRLFALLDAML
jgi:uncharacterized protein YgiB involved in biofilm formation